MIFVLFDSYLTVIAVFLWYFFLSMTESISSTYNIKQNKMPSLSQDKLIEYKQRAAFHEAGHAAGIHLNNKAKYLPSVFFKIIFKEISSVTKAEVMTHHNYVAQMEGGRLIELLPHSLDSWVHELTEHNDAMVQLAENYRIAYESDIINLLIGPLAEAKHIADIDDEPFNHQLITPKALINYGGDSNLALINKYLLSFFANKQKDEKLNQLFSEAFNFVNNDANWAAITKLADCILGRNCKNIICYEEIVLILDQSITNFKDRRVNKRHHYNGWFKVTADHIKINYAKSIKNVTSPSQAELDSMSHTEKDALILELFELAHPDFVE